MAEDYAELLEDLDYVSAGSPRAKKAALAIRALIEDRDGLRVVLRNVTHNHCEETWSAACAALGETT